MCGCLDDAQLSLSLAALCLALSQKPKEGEEKARVGCVVVVVVVGRMEREIGEETWFVVEQRASPCLSSSV